MDSNNKFKIIKKIIISTFFCLCCFFLLVSLFVAYKRKSNDGVLGRSKPPNSFVVDSGEGYFIGRMDKYGFNNDKMEDNFPYIIFSGDSYTEAFQLSRSKNYVSLINKVFPQYNCFNYGNSGNSIADYIYNSQFPYKEFNVVFNFIQVTQNDFIIDSQREDKLIYLDKIDMTIKARQNINSYDNTAEFIASKMGVAYPFIGYTYKKILQYFEKNKVSATQAYAEKILTDEEKNILIWELTALKEKYGDNFAIIYVSSLPSISSKRVNMEKSKYTEEFENYLFSKCEELDIDIIDTNNAFIDFYNETNQLPRGFNNTKPGSGHINEYGHKIISELVVEYLNDKMGVIDNK